MKKWEKSLRRQRLSALVSENNERKLARNLSIIDANSLFDHLSRKMVGTTNDKRIALEMQIVREVLSETNTCIKWVPHPRIIVDSLIKRHSNLFPLIQLLRTSVLELKDTTNTNNKSTGAINRCQFGVSCVRHKYNRF